MAGNYYIGTSAWAHKEWGPKFFPKDVPQRKHLAYLASVFNTVEINATFYRNQPESTFEKWFQEAPGDFVFATKISRYLTHVKRLKKIQPYWSRFADPTKGLGKKRGPFLLQLPPSWDGRPEHAERIDAFLTEAKKTVRGIKIAVELRHKDCFNDEMIRAISKHKAALVFANSTKYPEAPDIAPANFVYFRLHGPRKMFASSYQPDELKTWAKRMRKYYRQGKDVFVYFNNDQHAHAPANAQLLQKLLKYKR